MQSVLFNIEICNDIDELSIIRQELINQKYINVQKRKGENKNTIKNEPIKYLYEGYSIYVGKNNTQNDYLTHKFAHNNDIWLHTQLIHGSHVIIRNIDNSDIPDNVIEFASSLAAYYSKAQNSNKVMRWRSGSCIFQNGSFVGRFICECKGLVRILSGQPLSFASALQ